MAGVWAYETARVDVKRPLQDRDGGTRSLGNPAIRDERERRRPPLLFARPNCLKSEPRNPGVEFLSSKSPRLFQLELDPFDW